MTCSIRTNGQTDGHDEINSRFSQFCERAKQWILNRCRQCGQDRGEWKAVANTAPTAVSTAAP